MRTVTLNDIRSFGPCYDPVKYLSENWEGTAIDILNVTDCPAKDRLWVVLRNKFLSDRDLRLFAVWCARQALAISGNENEVCSNTCDVAERFANGQATNEELAAARDAARDSAWDAAWDAERAAAWAAARDAARDAAWAAAWAAARDAARAAAWAAAMDAAMDAARDAQIERLKEILNQSGL